MIKIIILAVGGLLAISTPASTASFVLTHFYVACVRQCDAIGSDHVYVTIPVSSINHKTTGNIEFIANTTRWFKQIGPNSGSASTAWFIAPGDKIRVMEDDLIDPDDLIREITVTREMCDGHLKSFEGTNGTGKYRITFTIRVI